MINSCAFSFFTSRFSSCILCLLHPYLSFLHLCMSVCMFVCLCLFICLSLCLSVALSLSFTLSLSIYRSLFHFRYISFCLCLFRSIIQNFYLTQWDYFFSLFLVRLLVISPSLFFSLFLPLSLFLDLFLCLSFHLCVIIPFFSPRVISLTRLINVFVFLSLSLSFSLSLSPSLSVL